MKNYRIALLVCALLVAGFGCGKSKEQPKENMAEKMLSSYSYDGVPEALAAQHRIEALSVNQVSDADRLPVVQKYADKAVQAFKDKKMFRWHMGVRDDQRVLAYAMQKDNGECVGFTAYYSLKPTGGKQNNEITAIGPSDLCKEQTAADKEANEKKDFEKAEELLRELEG